MAVNTKNVLVGTAQLYIAPWATVPPALPAITVTVWAPTWVPMGATEQGVKLTVARKTVDIMVEEQPTPAQVTTDTMTISITTSLAEDTIANMKVAYGGGTITAVAPSVTKTGTTTLTLALGLDKLTVAFQGVNAHGFTRRFYIPEVLSVASVDTSYRRAAAARLYPVKLRAICTPSDVMVVDKTAVKT